ncbi:hypothetical protein LguiA_011020 [Lonicera macranthoides]
MLSISTTALVFAMGASKQVKNTTMSRCFEREREALLAFKDGFQDDYQILSSWGRKEDCCKWSGIKCDNKTGHVTTLDLSYLIMDYRPKGKMSPALLELRHLKHLDLSYTDFGFNPVPKFIGSLQNLKYLGVRSASLSGSLPPQLGNLSKLHRLDFSGNDDLGVENLDWLPHLSSLRYLDLHHVNLSRAIHWVDKIKALPSLSFLRLASCDLSKVNSPIDHAFVNTTSSFSIVTLDLSNNGFDSSIFSWFFNLSSNTLVNLDISFNQIQGPISNDFGSITSLRYLFLQQNQFTGVIPRPFRNLCKLGTLDLSSNKLSGNLTDSLRSLYGCIEVSLESLHLSSNTLTGSLEDVTRFSSLRQLILSNNRLTGVLPKAIGVRLPNLNSLDLSSNSLHGTVSEAHFLNLTKLTFLLLSSSFLSLNLSSHWVPPFQLESIELRSCGLGPHLPKWLQTQTNLRYVDLSNNTISNPIPMWLWDLSPKFMHFDLSSNKIRGLLPILSSKFGEGTEIDLSYNYFVGPLPVLPANVSILNLSNNKLSGTLRSLCSVKNVYNTLDLSHNLFTGEIPDCLRHWKYSINLNFAHNKLTGRISSYVASSSFLKILNLRNNTFSGELPLRLKDCTSLVLLDVGYNNLSGNVPSWIGESLLELSVLTLPSNKLHGSIPLTLCHLQYLRILDLSMNTLNGTIPSCFSNFTAMVQKESAFSEIPMDRSLVEIRGGKTGILDYYLARESIIWKGREAEYGVYSIEVKVIDLSCNNLTGKFPEALTNLVELVALNLSRNIFYGAVPPRIGQLKLLQSLDLSRNRFSGRLPTSLAGLNYLSALDLSYNRFSGRIPLSTQLQSFDSSTYRGNGGLCGPPLTQKCPGDETISNGGNGDNHDHGNKKFEFLKSFFISLATVYGIAACIVCCCCYFRRRRRNFGSDIEMTTA